MRSTDTTFESPEENLAFDEVLLNRAEAGDGGETLRFWESAGPFVVLGVAQRVETEVRRGACEADGVPILRRCSAGGCVLQMAGCLNYTLVLNQQTRSGINTIRGSYCELLGRISDALVTLGRDVRVAGTSDLAWEGRKVSGNAQRRKKTYILHHGTLLYDADLQMIPKYLKEPSERPSYRGERGHGDFVRNLDVDRAALVRAVSEAFSVGDFDSAPSEGEREDMERLVVEKYRTAGWTFRR